MRRRRYRTAAPGDPVGVSLLGGDGEMGATGTVTHIDGDRVYAFGHPFFNFGPTAFPMTRAHVYATLPSLMSSFKIATMGDVIGTMQQDRATAIAGTLGKGPAVIPITVTLESRRAAPARTFHYTVVNDQLFTPLLTYVALFNTLGNYERQFGAVTFTVKGKAHLRQARRPRLRRHLHRRQHDRRRAAAYVAGPITMLLGNDVEPVTVKGVELTVDALGRVAHARRSSASGSTRSGPRAGRTVPLKVLTRSYRGDGKDLDRADRDPGQRLRPAVHAGHRRPAAESDRAARAAPHAPAAERRADDPRAERHAPQQPHLRAAAHRHARRRRQRRGADRRCRRRCSSVLEGDRSGGSFTPIRSAALGEWELPMDSAITGSRVLTIDRRRPLTSCQLHR